MCAINPRFKKRFLLDVYTSNPKMTKEDFEGLVIAHAVDIEQQLNSTPVLRWHIKETDQEAE
jgi:hypothetical protein